MKPTSKHLIKKGFHVDESLPKSLAASELLHQPRVTKKFYQDLIEIKRVRTERNEALSNLFLSIGLSLSLLFAIIGINWRSYENGDIVDLGQLNADFEEILEVPPSQQPPPPPPKAEQVILQEVDNEEVIEELQLDFDIEITQETSIEAVIFEPKIEEEKVDQIFQVVEDKPEPVGGFSAFYQFVGENIHYPQQAIRLNVSGVVFINFVVEKDGRLTDVKVVKGIGSGCDQEAVRVLQGAPSWKPGRQRGKPVRVYMTVPIRFVLSGSS